LACSSSENPCGFSSSFLFAKFTDWDTQLIILKHVGFNTARLSDLPMFIAINGRLNNDFLAIKVFNELTYDGFLALPSFRLKSYESSTLKYEFYSHKACMKL
jgi:hypothetical protein